MIEYFEIQINLYNLLCILYIFNNEILLIMKKIFTLLFSSALFSFSQAGTPVINGVYDGAEGWGTPVYTGDGIAGWADANAKKLYVTFDDNYIYFGAEIRAESWQQFIIALNTKAGGSSTDAWGRTIAYNHSNPPDFLFRGDAGNDNYTEFHIWDGAAWTETGINRNGAGTEVKATYDGSRNGFIEIRVPRSVVGDVTTGDVQFIIGGNSGGPDSGHGNFDSMPEDNVGTAWSAPGNFTSVSNYVTNITLPIRLASFTGDRTNNTISLFWETQNQSNLSKFIVEQSKDGITWQNAGSVSISSNGNYQFVIKNIENDFSIFRLKMIEVDGGFTYSKNILLKNNLTQGWSIVGNISNNPQLVIAQTEKSTVTMRLLSVTGKLLQTNRFIHNGGVSNTPIVLQSSGMHFLQVESAGERKTFKLFNK